MHNISALWLARPKARLFAIGRYALRVRSCSARTLIPRSRCTRSRGYMACIRRSDWQGVAELMLLSANKLAKIGGDFLICPDNTIHQALPYVEARSPLRWLHIPLPRTLLSEDSSASA